MGDKTRTVLIWFNNDEQRIELAVNPNTIRLSRPQIAKVLQTITGEAVSIASGRGLMQVEINTFLPSRDSRFYRGIEPEAAIAMLKSWQSSFRPVRLIISDSDINDAFLITELTQIFSEGDRDTGISIKLKEYKFVTLGSGAALSPTAGGLLSRGDERKIVDSSYIVRRGDTLWAIAATHYGDGTRWREIAKKNGIKDPKKLKVGQVLKL